MRVFAVPFLILALSPCAAAQVPRPGETQWGTNQYVEYIVGNGPIVISAPHGGYLMPGDIADRISGTITQDRRSQEMVRDLAIEIAAQTGRRPHVVISHLHRLKLDANREIVEAAQGDVQAEQAWTEYHGFIDTAIAAVTNGHGAGLYIDLHGHSHPEGWVEFGYLLSATDLALTDAMLQDPAHIDTSSLRALGNQPGTSFPEIIRGTTSLGGHVEGWGYDCVPGPTHPDPAGGNYFTGGFDLDVHSSVTGNHAVDGVQIELPYDIRETRASRAAFATCMTSGILAFFVTHHGTDLTAGPRHTIAATDAVATETGSTAAFTVTRTGDLSAAAVVSYDVSGTAMAGADYLALGGSVTIPVGAASATVAVSPLDDGALEGTETIVLALTGGIEIGAASEATVRLLDNEGEPDLVLWLDLNDGAGPTATDTTGSGHDGTLLPGEATGPQWVTGLTGGALAFDEVDDAVRVTDFAYAPSGGFSFGFWFNAPPMSGTSFQYMVSQGLVGVPSSLNIHFKEATGRLRTNLAYDNDLLFADAGLDIHDDFRDGQWHLYVLTSAPGELTRIHVDGALMATAFLHGDTFDPSSDLYFGARSDLDPSRFFGGLLDDVRVWSRSLDPAEARALFTGPDADAAVYPGSGEDLVLGTGVDGDPVSGPLLDVVHVPTGSVLSVQMISPSGTFNGSIALIGAQFFIPGSPPSWPGFSELWFSTGVFFFEQAPALPGVGIERSYAIPAFLSGLTFMMQGVVVDPTAINGFFAATDAHELRVQ